MDTTRPFILVVDDDQNILAVISRLLRARRREWDMEFVESADRALSMAEERPAQVLVTDLSMPGMSGLDLVRAMQESSPDTQCIILTGTADLQVAAEIINTVNVFRFYTKPCPVSVLADGIASALEEYSSRKQPAEPHPGSAVLDRLATGVLVLSRKSEVVYMNQSAAAMVTGGDSLFIGRDQVLRASSAQDTGQLREAVGRMADQPDDVTALSVARASGETSLKLVLASTEISEGHVTVFVSDPERSPLPSAEVIGRLFGLTPRESQLALELVRGQRVEDIADTLNITLSSARTYIKRVMEKTGTSRQVELVRLILGALPFNVIGRDGAP